MSQPDVERLLRRWLEDQRETPAPLPDGLRARVAAIPSEVALPWRQRLREGLRDSSRRGGVGRRMTLAVAVVGLGGVALAAAVGGGSRPDTRTVPSPSLVGVTVEGSPSPAASASESVVELQPRPSADTACVNNLVDVQPAHGRMAVADGSLPTDTRVAYIRPVAAVAETTMRADIVVDDGRSANVVASVRSDEPLDASNAGVGGASVIDWSADGRTILVWAGRWSPSTWFHECSNIWLVAADGSSTVPLTDNRQPGFAVLGPGLYRGGMSLSRGDPMAAFTQSTPDGAALRVVTGGGTATTIEPACGGVATGFGWTADGRSLAVACTAAVAIVDPSSGTLVPVAAEADLASSVAWMPDGRLAIAIAQPPRVDVFDPATGSLSRGPTTNRPDASVLQLRPDGRMALAGGCRDVPATQFNSCFDTDLLVVTSATGEWRSLWTGPHATDAEAERTNDAITGARWLTDGTIVLADATGTGTIRIEPATGKTTTFSVPAGAAWWVPVK